MLMLMTEDAAAAAAAIVPDAASTGILDMSDMVVDIELLIFGSNFQGLCDHGDNITWRMKREKDFLLPM